MNWINEALNINYVAVAVAAFASYTLGFIWYSWPIFGAAWAKSLGITKEEADNTEGLGGAFIAALASGALKSIVIALLLAATNTSGIVGGALFGAITSLALIFTSLAYYNGFARSSSKLTLINGTHSTVELTLVGALIGIFS